MSTLFMWYFSYGFRIFVWVAARLLHTSGVRNALARFSVSARHRVNESSVPVKLVEHLQTEFST